MKIFDAMLWKRQIGTGCKIDVKMLETLKDGLVLTIEQNLVSNNALEFITNFVNQHNLSLLLDCERYFISTHVLKPSRLSVWEN